MADVASGAAGAPASTAGASKKTEPAKATSSSKVVVDPRFVIPSAWSKDKDKEKLPPPSSAEEEDDDDDDDAAGGGAEDSSDADDDGSEAGSEDHSGDEDAEEVDSDDGGGGDDEGSGDDDAEGAGAADGVAGDSAVGEKRKRPMGATELAPEKLAAFQKAEKRKGIVYIGRVPPFMKPIKLRQLLAPYGDIGRVYLAPEDPAARKRRIAAGGNKKPMFTEGWVEFMKKKDAKFVVATLNNEPMGESTPADAGATEVFPPQLALAAGAAADERASWSACWCRRHPHPSRLCRALYSCAPSCVRRREQAGLLRQRPVGAQVPAPLQVAPPHREDWWVPSRG